MMVLRGGLTLLAMVAQSQLSIASFATSKNDGISSIVIQTEIGTAKDEKMIYLARIARKAGLFENMFEFLKVAIKAKPVGDFTWEERNILSVGFKSLTASKRRAIREIGTKLNYSAFGDVLEDYRKRLQDELYSECIDIVNIVKHSWSLTASDDESACFVQTIFGNIYGHLAEFGPFDKQQEFRSGALKAYQAAQQLSYSLEPTNPIRLSLDFNFFVFYHEVMNEHGQACDLGKTEFYKAIAEIDKVVNTDHRDTTEVLQLISDHLTLWGCIDDIVVVVK